MKFSLLLLALGSYRAIATISSTGLVDLEYANYQARDDAALGYAPFLFPFGACAYVIRAGLHRALHGEPLLTINNYKSLGVL